MKVESILSGNVNTCIQIVDKASPIVILFGPPCCGKTLLLFRLVRYLCQMGCYVEPDTDFMPVDSLYQRRCKQFSEELFSDSCPTASVMLPVLINVFDKQRRRVCYILEQSGENCFDIQCKESPLRLKEIIECPNKKIWMFFVEKENKMDILTRQAYINRIMHIRTLMRQSDKAIVVCTKVDKDCMSFNGVDKRTLFKEIKDKYPGLFETFFNPNPILKYLCKYNFKFLPFSVGTFNNDSEGRLVYIQGDASFPKMLWKVIKD